MSTQKYSGEHKRNSIAASQMNRMVQNAALVKEASAVAQSMAESEWFARSGGVVNRAHR
ncbi:hypothetical protein [Trinickia violacea]|uniref:hypothetical protein n=1 Tax=Trinickia violacea TaxID=2571746 RepID=UPI001586C244|nr:hypothetical protein [Trinickia violacea]